MKTAHHSPARAALIANYKREDDYPALTEALVIELLNEKIAFYERQLLNGQNDGVHCVSCQIHQCRVILQEISFYYGNRFYEETARAIEYIEQSQKET